MSIRDKYKSKYRISKSVKGEPAGGVRYIMPKQDLDDGDSFLVSFIGTQEGNKGNYGKFKIIDSESTCEKTAKGNEVLIGGHNIIKAIEENKPDIGSKLFLTYQGMLLNRRTGNRFYKWDVDFIEEGTDDVPL